MSLDKEKIEQYIIKDKELIKKVLRRNGTITYSSIPFVGSAKPTPEDYDKAWLNLQDKPSNNYTKQMNLVDLFCGTGPMSLGVIEAGRCLGINIVPRLAIDFDKNAALNYKFNFPESNVINGDVTSYINGKFGDKISKEEKVLL